MSNPYKAKDFTRFNIHKNKKGQNIYVDKRSNIGYILDEEDIKRIQLFHSRLFYAIALGILLYGFVGLDMYICIAIAAVAAMVLEFYFRYRLLPSFPQTNNLEGIVIRDVKEVRLSQQYSSLWVKIIGYLGGGIALIALISITDYELWQKICVYVFSSYAIFNGIMNFLAVLEKKRKEK